MVGGGFPESGNRLLDSKNEAVGRLAEVDTADALRPVQRDSTVTVGAAHSMLLRDEPQANVASELPSWKGGKTKTPHLTLFMVFFPLFVSRPFDICLLRPDCGHTFSTYRAHMVSS